MQRQWPKDFLLGVSLGVYSATLDD